MLVGNSSEIGCPFMCYFSNVATMTEIVGQKLDLFQIKRDTMQHQSSIKLNTKPLLNIWLVNEIWFPLFLPDQIKLILFSYGYNFFNKLFSKMKFLHSVKDGI